MGKNKPEYRVTKTEADTGKRSTVARHTTSDAAAQARHDKRAKLPRGTSDWFTVDQIKHRGGSR